MNYEFDNKDIVCLGVSALVGGWYLWKKVSQNRRPECGVSELVLSLAAISRLTCHYKMFSTSTYVDIMQFFYVKTKNKLTKKWKRKPKLCPPKTPSQYHFIAKIPLRCTFFAKSVWFFHFRAFKMLCGFRYCLQFGYPPSWIPIFSTSWFAFSPTIPCEPGKEKNPRWRIGNTEDMWQSKAPQNYSFR